MPQGIVAGGTFKLRFEGFETGLVGTARWHFGGTAVYHTTGITEDPEGSGSYEVTGMAPLTDGRIAVQFDDGTTDYVATDYLDVGDDLASIKLKTDVLGDAIVVVQSPVLSANHIELVRGDDYLSDLGRSLEFSSDDWPSLGSVAPILEIGDLLTIAGTRSVVGAVQTLEFELTAGDTVLLIDQLYTFAISAVIGGEEVTLCQGKVKVRDRLPS